MIDLKDDLFYRKRITNLIMPEKDKTADHPVGPDGKKLKPCCVCLDTKKVRDECIMEKVRLKLY